MGAKNAQHQQEAVSAHAEVQEATVRATLQSMQTAHNTCKGTCARGPLLRMSCPSSHNVHMCIGLHSLSIVTLLIFTSS